MDAGNRDLVVIGGSAGSSGPLKTLLSSLPKDLPASILVVVHMPSSSAGLLPPLSTSSSIALPVQNAVDGAELSTGHVYLAPPNRHLLVIDGHLKLGTGPRENLSRPAIDPLFRSAAISHGPRAIGLILSGMLNDGASGLAAIKRGGGIALVQAPSDCEAPEMPSAALEATPVDLSAPRHDLPAAVLRFVSEAPGPAREVTRDILLDVEIAAGNPVDHDRLRAVADPATITCPDCGGVLSEIREDRPLRFRCQVGHAFTDKTLLEYQEGLVDEAMRVALRIIEERAALVAKMGREARQAGRMSLAEMHDEKAVEYKEQADILRKAILSSMDLADLPDPAESIVNAQVPRSGGGGEAI
jgi:two-component system, chemotaxis family, protein-glutamate methylesterase/glutaminase